MHKIIIFVCLNLFFTNVTYTQTSCTFPLLHAIFDDKFQELKILLRSGVNPNRNFGVGTAVDYAHMYGKYQALEILKRHGGKSGRELGMSTIAMIYNPSPRRS